MKSRLTLITGATLLKTLDRLQLPFAKPSLGRAITYTSNEPNFSIARMNWRRKRQTRKDLPQNLSRDFTSHPHFHSVSMTLRVPSELEPLFGHLWTSRDHARWTSAPISRQLSKRLAF